MSPVNDIGNIYYDSEYIFIGLNSDVLTFVGMTDYN